MIDLSQQLSPHFTLREMVRSAHQAIDNTPTEEIVERLRNLCVYLEKIRQAFGKLEITSGYRCPSLNMAIGGAKDSAHIYGCAADIYPLEHGVTVAHLVRWIKASNLDFDQVIDEGTDAATWCHFGLLRPGHELMPRREALMMRNGRYSLFSASQP